MKTCALILLLGSFWLKLSALSQTTNRFYQFVHDQSKRQYTGVPREVLAFYYQWYGQPGDRNAWGDADTNRHVLSRVQRYPVKGPYQSQDVAVIDWQIDQAKAHGVTGFILCWWENSAWESWNNRALALMLDRAELKDFKIALQLEIAPGEGQEQIDRAVEAWSWPLKEYGRRKAFLKVDGKPVVFPYAPVFADVPVTSWPKIIDGVRARAGDFLILPDGHQGHYAWLFDGIHSYAPYGIPVDLERKLTPAALGQLRSWVARYYAEGVKMARQRSRVSCLMVTPGCDARKAYKFDWQTDRLAGKTYRTFWEEAVRADPDWIVITSWNEWPEGTEIEPSLELGDLYLKITAEYARPFLNRPPVSVPRAAALPTSSPGTTRALDQLLSGRKIGVLMQDRMSDAEFWAACCGGTLQRVTWKDLIEPKVFSASNFPVLVHIGTDHYTSSVKVTDDVSRSFVRYLREGGFLVSLPTATWPLLYDDSRKGEPYGITDMLALGIDNGFEQPPPGAELTFHARTNVLFGLPLSAPFPVAGDLRWRPASRARIPIGDIYVPLAALRESNGRIHGDAVAYIEHRLPPLAGGKTLYVWMRTAEAFGPDVFYPSLYQFVSTRLKPAEN